jgi:hypothetical protein
MTIPAINVKKDLTFYISLDEGSWGHFLFFSKGVGSAVFMTGFFLVFILGALFIEYVWNPFPVDKICS